MTALLLMEPPAWRPLQIAMFRFMDPPSPGQASAWVYLDTRRPHTHDVRAMLVTTPPGGGPLLLTGSTDTHLIACAASRFGKVGPSPV